MSKLRIILFLTLASYLQSEDHGSIMMIEASRRMSWNRIKYSRMYEIIQLEKEMKANENKMQDICPKCGKPEIISTSPRTGYACGSSDYDQRPETFVQSETCKGEAQTLLGAKVETLKTKLDNGEGVSIVDFELVELWDAYVNSIPQTLEVIGDGSGVALPEIKDYKPPKTQNGTTDPDYWNLPLSEDGYRLQVNKCPHCGEYTPGGSYVNPEVPDTCDECGGKFRSNSIH